MRARTGSPKGGLAKGAIAEPILVSDPAALGLLRPGALPLEQARRRWW